MSSKAGNAEWCLRIAYPFIIKHSRTGSIIIKNHSADR